MLPGSLCFGSTKVYTAVLFQVEGSESSDPVSFLKLVWDHEAELWIVGENGEEKESFTPINQLST